MGLKKWLSKLGFVGAAIGAVVGFVMGGPVGAVGFWFWQAGFTAVAGAIGGAVLGGTIGFVAQSLYGALAGDPDMVSVGTQSNTYSGPYPVLTVERGTPIPLARGKLRMAGNVLRVNDPAQSAYYKMIMGHCQGQSDTTVQYKSGTTFLAYFVNGVEWSKFTAPDHKFLSHSGSTYHKSGVSCFFDTEVSNFRGLTLTEFKLRKNTEDVKGVQNINIIGRFGRCLDIGEDSGGIRSFTRNPAQVLWDWYVNKEGYSASQLNQDAFEVLEEYCDYVPPDSESVPVWPPGPSDLTVKATSFYASAGPTALKPFRAFDKDAPLTGRRDFSCWLSDQGSITNQRINIDLGAAYIVDKVEIENDHNSGADTNWGVARALFGGSNTRSHFEDVSYVSGGWVGLGPLGNFYEDLTEHVASDIADPQVFDYSGHPNPVAYRYITIAMDSNHGSADHMGLRRVKFYGKSPRYTFDYNFDAQITMNDAKKLIWKSFNGMCVMNQGQIKPVWDAAENCYGNATLLAKEDGDFLIKEDGDNILLERSQNKAISHRFTIDNIVRDSLSWSKPRRPNIVRVYYINSQDGFKKDSVEIRDESDIDAKGELLYEETCWWVTEPDVARRRARFKFDKARYTDYMCRLGGFPDSSVLEVLDRVTVSHPLPGWSGKDFLVVSKSEDNIGRPMFDLESYYAGLYHDRGYEVQETYGSKLPNPYGKLSGVTGVTLAEDAFFDNSGNWINKVKLTYTPDQNPFYSHSRVWLKAGSSGDGVAYGEYGVDTSGGNNFIINNIKGKFSSGSTITVKVEGISQAGMGSGTCPMKSVWASLPDIETEIAALTGDARMFLPNGTYVLSSGVTLPDYNIEIQGESQGGVVLKSNPDDAVFRLYDLTKTFVFNNFTIESQSTTGYDNMFYIIGSASANNSADIIIDTIKMTLIDDGLHAGNGDIGVYATTGIGNIKIINSIFNGGKYAFYTPGYSKGIDINRNIMSGQVYAAIAGFSIDWIHANENKIRDFLMYAIQIGSADVNYAEAMGNEIIAKDDALSAKAITGLNIAANKIHISDNIIKIFSSRTQGSSFWGIGLSSCINGSISDNIIDINGASTTSLGGIQLVISTDVQVGKNQIKVENSDVTANHYGIWLLASDRNILAANHINMVLNDAKDIGILLDADSDNNQGSDNITYNVGTSISDLGAGNTVTAKDV